MADDKKSVAIVAMGKSSGAYVIDVAANLGRPVADEVWAINAMGGAIKSDRIIVMDNLDVLGEPYSWIKEYEGRVISAHSNVAMREVEPYPLEEVLNYVRFPYFNTTVAYALGLAIYEQVGEIKLYGADFTYPDRHVSEAGRGCAEFWVAQAMLRGIAVTLPKSTTLIDVRQGTPLYNYNHVNVEHVDGRFKITEKSGEV